MKHHHERVGFYKDNRDYGHLLSSSGGGGGGARYGGGYSDDDADEAEEQEEEEEEMEEEEEEEEEEDGDQVAKKAAEEESLSRMQQEYLERRQKLKEMERQRIKKKLRQNPGSRTSLQVPIVLADKSENRDKKRRLPYENYGSFFGPSQTIVAKRVIEEARAKEEADRARARLAREAEAKEAEETQQKSASKARPDEYRTSSGSKVADVPKQVNERGLKLQRLKEARDYSFLFTDEDPTASVPKAKSESVTKPEKERPPQVLKTTLQKKSAVPIKSNTAARYEGKSKGGAPPKVNSGQDKKVALVKKKPVIAPPTSKSPGPKLHSSVSTANSKVVNGVKAPSQAPIQKKAAPSASVLHGDKLKKDPVRAAIGSHSKVTASTSQKAAIARSTEHKKPHASQLSERRPSTVHSRVEPKRPMPTDLVKKKPSQAKPLSVHEKFKSSAKDRRRPVESDSEGSFLDDDDIDDGGNVSSLIRKMFRYNPNKYRDLDDQDDRDMEVGFSRIQAEELRSARIAKKEDEQELALIEEEERRERMRIEAKKRKLSRK